MILVRYFLIGLIVYLLVRSFVKFGQGNKPDSQLGKSEDSSKSEKRKISKSVGEYVDYEEIKEDDF
ncbi:MAG TPA: hypothetical protein VMV47_17530 [Bacteroidales bacterium]|nr:hypothetical protein [Bacteroidales bacterium]